MLTGIGVRTQGMTRSWNSLNLGLINSPGGLDLRSQALLLLPVAQQKQATRTLFSTGPKTRKGLFRHSLGVLERPSFSS
jgi:hypothetical protein